MQDATNAPAETNEKNSSHLRCGAVKLGREPVTPRYVLEVPGEPVRIVYGRVSRRVQSRRMIGRAKIAYYDACRRGEALPSGHWDPNTCCVVADDLGAVTVDQ